MSRLYTRVQIRAFDDQVAAVLRDLGSGTTGDIREKMSGTTLPSYTRRLCACKCGELEHRIVEKFGDYPPDSTDIRMSLRRLCRQGKALEIPTPQPNNHGGHFWLWMDN